MKCDYCPAIARFYITLGYYEYHTQQLGEYHISDKRVCRTHLEELQDNPEGHKIYHIIIRIIDYEKICQYCKHCQQLPGRKYCNSCGGKTMKELLRMKRNGT